MSGSPGGRRTGGGGGGDVDDDICELLSFEAVVQSPQPAAVATLTVGEQLYVSMTGPAANVRSIEVRRSDGELVGAIVEEAPRLIACLARRYTYVAEVLAISGGAVTVRVRR